jgi:hypothetical protein
MNYARMNFGTIYHPMFDEVEGYDILFLDVYSYIQNHSDELKSIRKKCPIYISNKDKIKKLLNISRSRMFNVYRFKRKLSLG